MQAIKIRNRTTLTDFSALFRAALYLSGDKKQAEENGIRIDVRENFTDQVITISEEGGGKGCGKNRKKSKK